MTEERRRPTSIVLALLLLILSIATVPSTGQSTQHGFAWFGELVSVDRSAGTITIRAPFLPQVARYIDSFEPGAPIVAVWTQLDGEADAVLYVERREIMPTTGGYVVAGTITFTVPVGTTVITALVSAVPGTPIKLESPMRQLEAITEVASVTLDARPTPRPTPDIVAQIPADPNGPLASLAGSWSFESDLNGSMITMRCTLTQNQEELSGTCDGEMGQATMTGAVAGNTVRFTITVSVGDNTSLGYSGAVDATGARMEGDVSVMGRGAVFKGSRQ
jgi:hypothetical protein